MSLERPPHVDRQWWYRATWAARQAAVDAHLRTLRRPEPAPVDDEEPAVERARQCSEDGCDLPHHARGLCYTHYRRTVRRAKGHYTFVGERIVWADDELWSDEELRGAHAAYRRGDRDEWAVTGHRIWDRHRQRARYARRRAERQAS